MLKNHLIKLIFSAVILWLPILTFAQIKLPKLISDGMILQRNTNIKIWGWAGCNESISISFKEAEFNTKANNEGYWETNIGEFKAGGPYQMHIVGSDSVTINDILIGDIWVCSGQSNMEIPMKRVDWCYPNEIATSTNTHIRQFYVPRKYDFKTSKSDFESGSWVVANPETVLNFSAVGYFFAKKLYETYHVPIGFINSALGGSPAQCWISEEALKQFPKDYNELQKFKNDSLIESIIKSDRARSNAWYNESSTKDAAYNDMAQPWSGATLNTSDWYDIAIPGYWENSALGKVNGIVWYRKEFSVPDNFNLDSLTLILGRIVDADSVFLNGTYVGSTTYLYPPRRYHVADSIIKKGKNTIAIRVTNNSGSGGFVMDKLYALTSKTDTVFLNGEWKIKLGTEMPPLAPQTFIRWKPGGLYNAMINPLTNFKIKGVVWYQGESNTDAPNNYSALLTALITDWRSEWALGDFPFVIVQLPNFLEALEKPQESNWAMLRDQQLKASSNNNCALVVTTDLGEWNDIHPLKKKDVSDRIALAAQKLAYNNQTIVYSGPLYNGMEVKGNKIELTFTNIGSGLVAKGKELKHFAIAGADKNFIWANAIIKGNKIIVWSDKIENPLAVRYGWSDNPESANLYNKENLPASPFKTDNW